MNRIILALTFLAFAPITRARGTGAETKPGDRTSSQVNTKPRLTHAPRATINDFSNAIAHSLSQTSANTNGVGITGQRR